VTKGKGKPRAVMPEEEEEQQQQFVWNGYPKFRASVSHKIKDLALQGPMGQALFS
jgi:hypothetical protein